MLVWTGWVLFLVFSFAVVKDAVKEPEGRTREEDARLKPLTILFGTLVSIWILMAVLALSRV